MKKINNVWGGNVIEIPKIHEIATRDKIKVDS
jgi:hypothetical protein